MLKRIIRAFRYLAAALRVYRLEAALAAYRAPLEDARCPVVALALRVRYVETKQRLARARADLQTFYPPGTRTTWEKA